MHIPTHKDIRNKFKIGMREIYENAGIEIGNRKGLRRLNDFIKK